jgi:aryl-alcohol dehydrogenase-like predicted oxidoreductase
MRLVSIGAATSSPRRVSALALGAMRFGNATEEPTAFAILDRFLDTGGNFIDTANNYAWWHDGGRGGQSEALLGRWRVSRGLTDEVVIATKLGARPTRAGVSFADRMAADEGLSQAAIHAAARESRARLGVERLDLLYAHVEDPRAPIADTVAALGALVSAGEVALLGVSNHRAWRVERARAVARATSVSGYEVLQYHRSYLEHRADLPSPRSPFGDPGLLTADLLDYMTAEPGLVNVAYSPLLAGGYTRADKAPGEEYAGPGNAARLQTLAAVARETGATPNQVVLAWLMGDSVPTIPLVGASSVDQLRESLDALDLELSSDQRARLDSAR